MREPTTLSLWLSDHARVAPVLRVASWHLARGWSLARAEGVEERAAATAVTSVLDLGLRECASAFAGDGRWWPATARLVRSGKNPGERDVGRVVLLARTVPPASRATARQPFAVARSPL